VVDAASFDKGSAKQRRKFQRLDRRAALSLSLFSLLTFHGMTDSEIGVKAAQAKLHLHTTDADAEAEIPFETLSFAEPLGVIRATPVLRHHQPYRGFTVGVDPSEVTSFAAIKT
jgi:hypothetical protein